MLHVLKKACSSRKKQVLRKKKKKKTDLSWKKQVPDGEKQVPSEKRFPAKKMSFFAKKGMFLEKEAAPSQKKESLAKKSRFPARKIGSLRRKACPLQKKGYSSRRKDLVEKTGLRVRPGSSRKRKVFIAKITSILATRHLLTSFLRNRHFANKQSHGSKSSFHKKISFNQLLPREISEIRSGYPRNLAKTAGSSREISWKYKQFLRE